MKDAKKIADIEQVVHDGTMVVLATDQSPFEASGQRGMPNTFCVLVPLMTVDSARFEDLEEDFPNRGRVWWLLRNEDVKLESGVGMIVTARIEVAPRFNKEDPEKDRYQVERRTIHVGVRDWFEIVDVKEEPEDMGRLVTHGVPMDHRPTSVVVLRGPRTVIGPFRAPWPSEDRRVRLAALRADDPKVWRLRRAVLEDRGFVETFQFTANRHDPREATRLVPISLLSKGGVDTLQTDGEPVDAATDAQVVNWALGFTDVASRAQSAFKEILKQVKAVEPEHLQDQEERLKRFHSISADAERVMALGENVAAVLARQKVYEVLINTHVESLTRSRIDQLIGERQASIEKEIEGLRSRRDKLKQEVVQVEAEYDRLKSEQEERLAQESADWLQNLRDREQQIEEQKRDLEARAIAASDRLESVTRKYEEGGREIGDQLLAQLPVLRRLGVTSGPKSEEMAGRTEALRLPGWLSRPKTNQEIREESFVADLESVAIRRGLLFETDDLANFHVSVKSGLWTVLAGMSGVGKSSLPRVYAEALGCKDEFLMVSVRPDWLDDRDVIGAYNPFAGVFEPATTGLVEHLICAATDLSAGRGGIYVICLDEMNLARVEHYFARFLSVMELRPADRRLRLYSEGVGRPDDAFAAWRHLPIGNNVRFVGTVNIDETTHFFSPKVLDRAPVLTLEPPDLARSTPEKARAKDLGVTPVHLDHYNSWCRSPQEAPPDVREFLLKVDEKLRPIRSGLGFRIRDRILAHVASAKGILGVDRALDFALAQCVLPRIQINHARFSEVAGELVDLIPSKRFARAGRILEDLREADGTYDFFQVVC
jgi:dynein-related subfamily AAA family protein